MVPDLALATLAVGGFLTTLVAGSAAIYRHLPRTYPRDRTRLDARTYRVVKTGLAIGMVVGALGAVLSLVDTVGSLEAVKGAESGLLAGLAVLLPAWLGPAVVRVGVGLLVSAGLLAGWVELRNARQ